jgi:hypothetical protein
MPESAPLFQIAGSALWARLAAPDPTQDGPSVAPT